MLATVLLQVEPLAGLLERLQSLGRDAGQGMLAMAVAIAVLLAGWLAAALLSALVAAVLGWLHFDDAVVRVLGPRAAARREPTQIAAWAVYWLVLAGSVLTALDVLGFRLSLSVADRLADVLPRIVTSAVLFAVGLLLALLVGAVARRFLESAGFGAARFQGQVVSSILTGFAALLALEQLGFAAQFVMWLGIVAAAAAGLGLALAFGLGCRDLARDFLVEYLRSMDDEGPKRPS